MCSMHEELVMSVWFAGGYCSEWWPRFLERHWDIHEHHQATNSDDGVRPSIHLSVSMPRRVAETAHTTARELFLPRALFIMNCAPLYLPSVLWHCWLGDRNGMRPVKNWVLIFWCWHSSETLHMFEFHFSSQPPPSSSAGLKSTLEWFANCTASAFQVILKCWCV